MTRYKLTIEYDGTDFVGWQRQDNGPSIQQALERAVEMFCGERPTLYAAGRTDAGVHALGQVAHLDIEKPTDADTLRDALNFHLKPQPIAVLAAQPVGADFHARFSAKSRSYLYRIVNRRAPLALDRGRAWFVPQPLDVPAMSEAAGALVGHHDFSSFRAADCQAKSPVKTLDLLKVMCDRGDIRVAATARSFLYHQVRILVGTLKQVGEGKLDRSAMARVLAARERREAGPTAPACGLYFLEVEYE